MIWFRVFRKWWLGVSFSGPSTTGRDDNEHITESASGLDVILDRGE